MKPYFSVIIPVFNREQFIEQCITSVLNQTFSDFEIIVINDGSTDNSKEKILKLNDKRIKYIEKENGGVSSARNVGIKSSQAEWITFLDSDDNWHENKLETVYHSTKENSNDLIIHHNETWIYNGKEKKQKEKHSKPQGDVFAECLALCCVGMSCLTVHKRVFDKIGVFDESMEACEDYDFLLRASISFKFKRLEEYLTIKHGGHSNQLSTSIWGLDRFRIYALEKLLNGERLNKIQHEMVLEELKNKCNIFSAGRKRRGDQKTADIYREKPAQYNAKAGTF